MKTKRPYLAETRKKFNGAYFAFILMIFKKLPEKEKLYLRYLGL